MGSKTNVECVEDEAEGAAARGEAVLDTTTDIDSTFQSLDFSEDILALPYSDYDPFSFSESDVATSNIDLAFQSSFSDSDESLSQNVNANGLANNVASPVDDDETLIVLASEVEKRGGNVLEDLMTLIEAQSEYYVPNLCQLLIHLVVDLFYRDFIDESQCAA